MVHYHNDDDDDDDDDDDHNNIDTSNRFRLLDENVTKMVSAEISRWSQPLSWYMFIVSATIKKIFKYHETSEELLRIKIVCHFIMAASFSVLPNGYLLSCIRKRKR